MNEPALSPKRARYLHRLRQESRRVRLWQAALFVGFFAFWELSCRVGLSDGFLVSSPSRVAATFLTLCRGGDVLVHVGVSCWETVVGFLLGTAAGTVVAVAHPQPCAGSVSGGAQRPAENGAGSHLHRLDGRRDRRHHRHDAGDLADRHHSEHVRGLPRHGCPEDPIDGRHGRSRWQLLWMLVFPANYATLLNTLKVNVGLSWVGVIMGEFLVSRAGLGYLIVYGSQVFNMDLVMTSVLLLLVAAVVMYRLVLWVEKLLYRVWGLKA